MYLHTYYVNKTLQVLDDEAEVFVLKLWRLLIYETEARHLGIAKNYWVDVLAGLKLFFFSILSFLFSVELPN